MRSFAPTVRIHIQQSALSGVMMVANAINEGLHDAPQPEDGSGVRKTKKINSFMSGVKRTGTMCD